ncbi:MAG: helix-turn-helix domain-containing protein [Gemmatimonadota bacterium]|jgi:AraC-like DNA-binding protein|nr:helix-turn-helix domain-containing protein [Gemmatimonadota bacterium]
MRKPNRPLLVLHTDPLFRERLRRATRNMFEIRFVLGWDALFDAVRTSLPSGIVVVDPYHASRAGERLATQTGSLLRNFPSATVVAALEARPGWFHDVRTLGEWGVSEVLDSAAENTHLAILERLRSARGRPLRTLLERGVRLSLPGRGRAILDAAVETVATGEHARDLARTLHVSRDTLLRWCHLSGLPVPRRLLLWMRLLLAAEMLDNPGQTVDDVALACGYSSDDALRSAFRSTMRMKPSELRAEGAFRATSAAFLEEIAGGGTLSLDASRPVDHHRACSARTRPSRVA